MRSAPNIPHGYILLEARGGPARGHGTNRLSLRRQDFGALACRCAFYNQTDAATRDAALKLRQDNKGAEEATGLTAALGWVQGKNDSKILGVRTSDA